MKTGSREWNEISIAELGEVVGGGTPSRTVPSFWNGSIPWITPGEVTDLKDKYVRGTRERITEEGLAASAAKLLPVGSLLVTTRATLGKLAIAAVPVCTNQGFKSIIPNAETDSLFSYYLVGALRGEIERRASGTTFLEISKADFTRIRTLRPKLKEQESIAAILNVLDKMIANTDAVIGKLKQVRIGLLHDLLSNGLDEDNRLRDPIAHPEEFKDSPVGCIPADWKTSNLSKLLDGIDAGKSPDYPDRPAPPGEWGVLKVSAIWTEGFRAEENKWVTREIHQNPAYEIRDGDLLISRSNTYELVGLVCLVRNPPPRLLLCDKTLRLRVKPDCAKPEFLELLLQAEMSRRQIMISATGTSASMKNISQSAINSLKLAYPGLVEQSRILTRLAPVDGELKALLREFEKLASIKSGLASDLLTGRILVPVSDIAMENVT